METINIEHISGTSKAGKPYNGFKFIAGDYESPVFFPDKIHTDYLLDHYFNNGDSFENVE